MRCPSQIAGVLLVDLRLLLFVFAIDAACPLPLATSGEKHSSVAAASAFGCLDGLARLLDGFQNHSSQVVIGHQVAVRQALIRLWAPQVLCLQMTMVTQEEADGSGSEARVHIERERGREARVHLGAELGEPSVNVLVLVAVAISGEVGVLHDLMSTRILAVSTGRGP